MARRERGAHPLKAAVQRSARQRGLEQEKPGEDVRRVIDGLRLRSSGGARAALRAARHRAAPSSRSAAGREDPTPPRVLGEEELHLGSNELGVVARAAGVGAATIGVPPPPPSVARARRFRRTDRRRDGGDFEGHRDALPPLPGRASAEARGQRTLWKEDST